jgi:hypothetical protein
LGRECSANGGERNAYKILVVKPEGNRPLGRPIRRWVENIKMDLRRQDVVVMFWLDLAKDRNQWRALVNTVMKLKWLRDWRLLKKGSAA